MLLNNQDAQPASKWWHALWSWLFKVCLSMHNLHNMRSTSSIEYEDYDIIYPFLVPIKGIKDLYMYIVAMHKITTKLGPEL